MLIALLVCTMLASTARAGMMLERFEDFLSDPTINNFIVLVFYQFWGFFSPFMKGSLDVVLKYVWETGKLEFEYEAGTKISLGYQAAFGFIGVGNLNQFNNMIFETIPLILTNMVLSKADKKPYGTTVQSVLDRMKIDL